MHEVHEVHEVGGEGMARGVFVRGEDLDELVGFVLEWHCVVGCSNDAWRNDGWKRYCLKLLHHFTSEAYELYSVDSFDS